MTDKLFDEIKLAYKVHGLRPIQGFFFIRKDNGDFACPLTALAINQGIMDGVRPGFEFIGGAVDAGAVVAVEWAVKTFGKEWVAGFLDGFDDQEKTMTHADYIEGYELGFEIAKQLLPEP